MQLFNRFRVDISTPTPTSTSTTTLTGKHGVRCFSVLIEIRRKIFWRKLKLSYGETGFSSLFSSLLDFGLVVCKFKTISGLCICSVLPSSLPHHHYHHLHISPLFCSASPEQTCSVLPFRSRPSAYGTYT